MALRSVGCALSRLGSVAPSTAKVLPSGVSRVVLQAYSPHLAQFFAPVVDELRLLSSDVEIWLAILPHPHFPARAREQLRRLARERLSIPDDRVRDWWSVAKAPADLVLCADVFAELPRSGARSCLLLHGAGVASRMLRPKRFRRTIFDFDLVLTNGDFDRRRLLHAVRQAGASTRVEDVGLPFLDGLASPGIERRGYLEGLGLDPERPTIFFGPAWSGLATLPDRGFAYVRETVEALSELPVNVLVKLHACSLNRTMAGGVDWRPWLASRRSARVAVETDVADLPALAHCDVLVTDRSSRALNVQAVAKPVVVWDPLPAPEDPWDRERLSLIRRGSLIASGPTAAARLCSLAISDPTIGEGGVAMSREALSHLGGSAVEAARAVLRAAGEGERAPVPSTSGARRDARQRRPRV